MVLAGFTAALVLFASVPVDTEVKYRELRKSFIKAGWIYNRIHESSLPVNLAFIGSSHTVWGVYSRIVTEELERRGNQLKVANLSLCGYGRNMQYLLVKELLSKRDDVKTIVLEVREREYFQSHILFPNVASVWDAVCAPVFFNIEYVADLFKCVKNNATLFVDHSLNSQTYNTKSSSEVTGEFWEPGDLKHEIPRFVDQQRLKSEESGRFLMKIRQPFYYLEQIRKLSERKGVEVIFLYLPRMGCKIQNMVEKNYYASVGEIWVPPDDILRDAKNWADPGHLNLSGAEKVSSWLAYKIDTY